MLSLRTLFEEHTSVQERKLYEVVMALRRAQAGEWNANQNQRAIARARSLKTRMKSA